MVYTFFDDKTASRITINKQLIEFHKPVIEKIKRRKLDLAEMGSFSSRNKNLKYLSCVFSLNLFTRSFK